ncbi:MAG TPA: ScyD/ScyE family protein [Actinomycetales bacterium]|nr:ScyD/ScyE family protein [Actinomycetales bacterium]
MATTPRTSRRGPRRMVRALIAGACVPATAAGLVLSASAANADSSQDPAHHDLQRLPLNIGIVKNLDIGRGGKIVFADSSGPKVKVKEFTEASHNRGKLRTIATLPAGSANAAQSAKGDTWVIYGLAGGPEEGPPPAGTESATIWRIDKHGKAERVLDIGHFQTTKSPDPYDLEKKPGDSNPYDLEPLRDGSVLVADAGGNDLLRIWPNGKAHTVACFPDQLVSTDQVPPPVRKQMGPLPPKILAETVPTGVVLGHDGKAYVSELIGFPFPLHSSGVWRVDPNGHNVGCNGSPKHPVKPGKKVVTGFSGINDVTTDKWGNLYVTELSVKGIWTVEGALESGDPSGVAGLGRVTKVTKHGDKHVVGETSLTIPGSAVVTRRGHVYVSDMSLLGAKLVRIA